MYRIRICIPLLLIASLAVAAPSAPVEAPVRAPASAVAPSPSAAPTPALGADFSDRDEMLYREVKLLP